MVEVVNLSAVKRESIQSAQPLKWVFLLLFASLNHLSKCSSEQETRTKVINSEGRARRQEDEEGGGSSPHHPGPFLFTQTINRHTCKPSQEQT